MCINIPERNVKLDIRQRNLDAPTHRWQCEKRDGENAETRGHDFAHPRLRHRVAVADRCHRDDAPPERIRIAVEVRLTVGADVVLFGQIDKVRAKYQPEETDVQRCDELLQMDGSIGGKWNILYYHWFGIILQT